MVEDPLAQVHLVPARRLALAHQTRLRQQLPPRPLGKDQDHRPHRVELVVAGPQLPPLRLHRQLGDFGDTLREVPQDLPVFCCDRHHPSPGPRVGRRLGASRCPTSLSAVHPPVAVCPVSATETNGSPPDRLPSGESRTGHQHAHTDRSGRLPSGRDDGTELTVATPYRMALDKPRRSAVLKGTSGSDRDLVADHLCERPLIISMGGAGCRAARALGPAFGWKHRRLPPAGVGLGPPTSPARAPAVANDPGAKPAWASATACRLPRSLMRRPIGRTGQAHQNPREPQPRATVLGHCLAAHRHSTC